MNEELTEDELAELYQGLLRLREELSEVLTSARESSKPVDLDNPIGRLSRVDALQQQSMAKAHRQRVETRLRLTAQALELYKKGDYGFCRFCEEPIGYKRLKARPESPMCVACQTEREQG